MKCWFSVIAIFGLSAAASTGQEEAAKKDQKAAQGTWQILSWDLEGKAVTKEELNESKVKGKPLTIKNDKLSHALQGDSFEATFKLDPSKKPKAIDLTSLKDPDKGKTYLGIYYLEGNTLKICIALVGSDRPSDFKGAKNVSLMVFKRDKPYPRFGRPESIKRRPEKGVAGKGDIVDIRERKEDRPRY